MKKPFKRNKKRGSVERPFNIKELSNEDEDQNKKVKARSIKSISGSSRSFTYGDCDTEDLMHKIQKKNVSEFLDE